MCFNHDWAHILGANWVGRDTVCPKHIAEPIEVAQQLAFSRKDTIACCTRLDVVGLVSGMTGVAKQERCNDCTSISLPITMPNQDTYSYCLGWSPDPVVG